MASPDDEAPEEGGDGEEWEEGSEEEAGDDEAVPEHEDSQPRHNVEGAPAWGDPSDPATQEVLAKWFGGTQGKRVVAGFADEPEFSDEEVAAIEKARAAACAAVEPAFLARIEGRGVAAGEVIRPLDPLHLVVERVHVHDYSPAAWGISTAFDLEEVERPDDLRDVLRENAPQAVLGLDPRGAQARRDVAEMMSRSYRLSREDTLPIVARAKAALADLHEVKAMPWGELHFEKPEGQAPSSWSSLEGIDYDQ
jgi:hypothetical protein